MDRLMVSSMIAYGATVGPCFTYWEVWFLISGLLNVSVEFCESRTTLLYSWDATIATDLLWCIPIPVVGEPQPQSITVNEMIHVHVIDECVLAPTSRLSDLHHTSLPRPVRRLFFALILTTNCHHV